MKLDENLALYVLEDGESVKHTTNFEALSVIQEIGNNFGISNGTYGILLHFWIPR